MNGEPYKKFLFYFYLDILKIYKIKEKSGVANRIMISKKTKRKLNKGKHYLKQQDYDNAINCLKEGLRLAPDSDELWFNLGLVFLFKHKFRVAIKHFKKTIKLNPHHYIVFKKLGESYANLGEIDKAIYYYEKFIEIDPNDKEGNDKLEKLIDIQKNIRNVLNPIYFRKIRKKMEEALLLKNQLKFNDSINLYKEVIQLLNSILGSAKKDQFLKEVQNNIDSNYFDIINSKMKIGNLLIKQLKFDKAIETFRSTLEIADNIYDLNKKLEITSKIRELSTQTKINKIKNIILKLGTQFGRLHVIEIAEECKEEEHLIVSTINEMIKNKEFYAKYFESSKSVAFDQKTNIEEIDRLMASYKEWEEKEVGKK